MKFVVFGAGRMGQIHAGNIAANARATLAGVVDMRSDAAAELAGRHGAPGLSVDQALGDPQVAAVVIATPTDTHADLIEAAAKAGKAVFCEKPIDLSLERVDQAIRTVEEAGVAAMVAFNRRFDPTLGGLGRRVRDGEVGKVETVIITSRDPGPPPVSYIKSSGGLFRDMMIHDLDMAHWILGEMPVEVFAKGSVHVDPAIGEAGDVDTAVVTLTTASGVFAQISNNRRAAYGYDQRIEVLGADGMLRAGNHRPTQVESFTAENVARDLPLHFFLERYADAYRIELNHFIDCVVDGKQPSATMADGRAALILADAAQRSMETGQPVRIG